MSLLQKYLKVRDTSLQICAPLGVEDHSLQPNADASPAKWHLAHTTWFFETFVLSQYMSDFRQFHPAFRNLFNSYYNAVGDRPLRALRHILSRPSLDEVHAYRSYVDEAMVHLLTLEQPAAALDLIALGINHEQQHQELIVTDVKSGLWANPLRPAYRIKAEHLATLANSAPALHWHSFPEGVYSAGFEGSGFAFDNEGPRHNVYLGAFRLASRLVTNGEYVEFMRDGGYSNPLLWFSDGWDCVRNNQWIAPLYWEQRDGEWWNYTVEGMQPLQLNEPRLPRQFLRSRCLCPLVWGPVAQRVRVGSGGAVMPNRRQFSGVGRAASATCNCDRTTGADVWRCMGVDGESLRCLSGFQAGGGRGWRVQQQVHVQPDGAARRIVRDATVAHAGLRIVISFRPLRAGSSWG